MTVCECCWAACDGKPEAYPAELRQHERAGCVCASFEYTHSRRKARGECAVTVAPASRGRTMAQPNDPAGERVTFGAWIGALDRGIWYVAPNKPDQVYELASHASAAALDEIVRLCERVRELEAGGTDTPEAPMT